MDRLYTGKTRTFQKRPRTPPWTGRRWRRVSRRRMLAFTLGLGLRGGALLGKMQRSPGNGQPCALRLPPGCVHPTTLLPEGVLGAASPPGGSETNWETFVPGRQRRAPDVRRVTMTARLQGASYHLNTLPGALLGETVPGPLPQGRYR